MVICSCPVRLHFLPFQAGLHHQGNFHFKVSQSHPLEMKTLLAEALLSSKKKQLQRSLFLSGRPIVDSVNFPCGTQVLLDL